MTEIETLEHLDTLIKSKPKSYLTVNDLAECLNISTQAVYKYLNTNNIETYTTPNKRRLIPFVGVRRFLMEKGFTYPKKNISFQIVKGGVGKTSISFSLALRAHHYGARVLVIDMDQQANLTRSFNIEARDKAVWLNIFRDDSDISDAIINISEGLDLIPSSLKNSRLDVELTQSNANLKDTIRDKIDKIRNNYDLVIFDCPPAINKVNTSVTCASDMVIIPVNPDPYAIDGVDFTIAELKAQKSNFKLKFDFKLLWNRYDARERLSSKYMHDILKKVELVDNILPVVIRADISFKNSIFYEKSIFDLPKSNVKEDIDQLAQEILGLREFANSKHNK